MDINDIKKKITSVLKNYGITKAGIFGSIVRGEEKDNSDIDLLVQLPEKASLLELAGLKIDLEELLGKEFDVVTYDSLHPLLRDRILNEEVAVL